MTWTFGRNHKYVNVLGRNNLFKMNIEAVGKRQSHARFQIFFYALAVHACLSFVVYKKHYNVRLFRGFGNRKHFEARGLRLCPGLAALAQTYNNLYAAFAQIERVGVPLTAVTDNGNRLVFQRFQIAIGLIIYFRHNV